MKKTIKTLAAALAILLLSGLLFGKLGWLVQRKSSYIKNHDFYSQQADFDVLFFGSSHMINGVFPMELWRNYGIVSFNLGGHGAPIPTSCWLAKAALKETSPKVIVLDCAYAANEEKVSGQKEYLHQSTDAMPFSLTKLRMMLDLFPTWDDRAEFLWDYSIYHYRWASIDQSDLEVTPSPEKGAEARYAVDTPVKSQPIVEDNYWKSETVAADYIRDLAAVCRDKGVTLILTYLPHPDDRGIAQANSRGMEILAEELNIPCLNFLRLEDDLLDYRSDCYDPDSHLNASGARKVTNYFGQFLNDTCPQVPDHRQDSVYQGWYGDYAEYKQEKTERLQQEVQMDTVLMMLSDPDFASCLYLEEPGIWLEDEKYRALIKNLGVDTTGMPRKEPVLITCSNGVGGWAPLSDRLETPYGDAQLVSWEDKRILNWNEESMMQMQGYSDTAAAVARDADTGEIVLKVRFDAELSVNE